MAKPCPCQALEASGVSRRVIKSEHHITHRTVRSAKTPSALGSTSHCPQNACIEWYNRTVHGNWLSQNSFNIIEQSQDHTPQLLPTFTNARPSIGTARKHTVLSTGITRSSAKVRMTAAPAKGATSAALGDLFMAIGCNAERTDRNISGQWMNENRLNAGNHVFATWGWYGRKLHHIKVRLGLGTPKPYHCPSFRNSAPVHLNGRFFRRMAIPIQTICCETAITSARQCAFI